MSEDERARDAQPARRLRLPEFPAHPDADRARKRDGANGIARRSDGARAWAWNCCSASASASASTHYPTQLSGGEQQRVALARAFINRPKILFADEPTGNLDAETSSGIIEIMLELNRSAGTALVLVTHDPDVGAADRANDSVAQRRGSLMHPSFIWKMAWRDSRSSRRRLLVFSISITLGIAALVSIGSFRNSLAQAIDDQARTLIGADLIVESSRAFRAEEEAMLRSLGSPQAREVRFATMAVFPASGGTRLVSLRALGGDFRSTARWKRSPLRRRRISQRRSRRGR